MRGLAGQVWHSSHGAVVTFDGVVRDVDHGRHVVRLRYDVHPTTAGVLDRLVTEVAGRHPAAVLAVVHRHGDVPLGETAFAVVAAAAHRDAAFLACRDAVETVKQGLPVWKFQEFDDGTSEWVNCA